MSEQQSPLTYEGVLEMFRQTDRMIQELGRKMEETDRQMKETDRIVKQTSKAIASLGSRIGEIVENMVKGNIVDKFHALGYDVTQYSRNKFFEYKKLAIRGEVDLFLENGEVAILIEVKTTLETTDVRRHVERLEKYRRYANAASGDKRRFIGAVAGAVVTDEAATFAQDNGLYVIVQSGKAVEILTPPEGFRAKEW
ncbi:MAG: hypothetical protein FWF13_04225 [Acidobacteria bacterium]|nr:hypothetical protein [Acidobacteriota bacterium]